ncbi:MAG: SDR family oxidoreductase [Hyphomonadaceae bacterium]|nr:SDR family oxidoreductase [Hyphomonadaceae bacterium]
MSDWILITGAGQRLGRAIALEAARRGRSVALHYNASAAGAEDAAAQARAVGVSAVTVGADLADPDAAGALLTRAQAAAGAPFSGLVNSAAIFEHDLAQTVTAAAFERHMRVNALAPALLARAFAQALPAEARGAIVNILDFKLAQPYPDHFSYTVSKYALAGSMELMARGLAPRIRVNAVAPGYTLPAPGQPDADFARLHADTPLERGVEPADIAAAVLFLLEAPAVTGQTLTVDAGLRFRARDRDLAFS